MKNFKLLPNMLAFAISALFLTSCKTSIDPTPVEKPIIINGDTIKTIILKDYQKLTSTDPSSKNLVIIGDTIITYTEPILNIVTGKIDVSNLKNNEDLDLKGKPLRYVAIGGELTSGMRDGGYFNEGIITSYPNLLSRQMQLKKFEQPLFTSKAYNGYGRKALTKNNYTGGPVPKLNYVKNNSAVQNLDGVSITIEKYKGDLDNFAVPYVSTSFQLDPRKYSVSDESYSPPSNLTSQILGRVVTPIQNKYGFVNSLLSKKFDFFSLELGWSDVIGNLLTGFGINVPIDQDKYINGEEQPSDATNLSIRAEVRFMRILERNKIKNGILLNVPNILKFPYFKIISNDLISKNLGNQSLYFGYPSDNNGELLDRSQYILLPTSEVDSLMSNKVATSLKKGLNSKRPLSTNSICRNDNIKGINEYNVFINSLGKRYKYPVVDLYSLYEKILEGNYMTDDGVRVDATWITGNFFSSDGIYPSAFGQAVITNEIIKTINRQYQTIIPLINTKEILLK